MEAELRQGVAEVEAGEGDVEAFGAANIEVEGEGEDEAILPPTISELIANDAFIKEANYAFVMSGQPRSKEQLGSISADYYDRVVKIVNNRLTEFIGNIKQQTEAITAHWCWAYTR